MIYELKLLYLGASAKMRVSLGVGVKGTQGTLRLMKTAVGSLRTTR